jgi:hypothetical protein
MICDQAAKPQETLDYRRRRQKLNIFIYLNVVKALQARMRRLTVISVAGSIPITSSIFLSAMLNPATKFNYEKSLFSKRDPELFCFSS